MDLITVESEDWIFEVTKNEYKKMKKVCKKNNISIDYFMYEFHLEESTDHDWLSRFRSGWRLSHWENHHRRKFASCYPSFRKHVFQRSKRLRSWVILSLS